MNKGSNWSGVGGQGNPLLAYLGITASPVSPQQKFVDSFLSGNVMGMATSGLQGFVQSALVSAVTLAVPGSVARVAPVVTAARGVVTPQGTALQALTPEALALRNSVAEGQSIFRAGNFPRSAAAEGQYWSTQSPLSSGYANSVGAANLGASTPEFIMGGSVRPGANFITRPAPPYGGNAGGGLEIVTDPNALRLDFFHMP